MKVLFASSEITPYASTGGLGEVSGSLPRALEALGLEVVRIMPMYRQAAESRHALKDTGLRFRIPVGFRVYPAEIWEAAGAVPGTLFVRRDEFFDRSHLYGAPERDYDDNFERFVFFQKTVAALAGNPDFAPDLVHCNDWATALIPLFLRFGLQGVGGHAPGRTRCMLTLHNLAYQGTFPASEFAATNLPFSCFSIRVMEFYGKINCLKAGLMSAEAVNAVSRGYARETLTPEYGCGLEGVLQSLGERYAGIANGIEESLWDPATDPQIPHHYTPGDLSGKAECKRALLSRLRLQPPGDPVLLIGMISRLVDQKGLDILAEAMPGIMDLPVCFALLGRGDPNHEAACREWRRKWPKRFHATLRFDEKMARRIQAGADVLLMPSKFEPCGLTQLTAMRYGTVPVAHATGGLRDTVRDADREGERGTGFTFQPCAAERLLESLKRAHRAWREDPRRWLQLQKRIMTTDHSWRQSAGEYRAVYDRILSEPPRPISSD